MSTTKIERVLQQRRQGPDTPHHTGPVLVLDQGGNLVPGYKGRRRCLLEGREGPCGRHKVTEHDGLKHAPVCAECLKCEGQ